MQDGCHVVSCHVVSCLVVDKSRWQEACPVGFVLSRCVWGHVLSRHVVLCMSCHVMSCRVISCHVMSCPVMSRHVMSRLVILCRVMSYGVWLVRRFASLQSREPESLRRVDVTW